MQITEAIREWDYGDYEGRTSPEIRKERKEKGEQEWDIWKDGCPGGESPQQVMDRLDGLIGDIRKRFHGPAMANEEGGEGCADVLVVAHGHILRAFAMRWIGRGLTEGVSLLLEGELRFPCDRQRCG